MVFYAPLWVRRSGLRGPSAQRVPGKQKLKKSLGASSSVWGAGPGLRHRGAPEAWGPAGGGKALVSQGLLGLRLLWTPRKRVSHASDGWSEEGEAGVYPVAPGPVG